MGWPSPTLLWACQIPPLENVVPPFASKHTVRFITFATMKRILIAALTLGTLLGQAPDALAEGMVINWNSEVLSNFIQQDGTSLLDSSFTFDIGTFVPGFVPTADNMTMWNSNFKTIQSASVSNGMVDYVNGYYGGSFEVTSNNSPFERPNQGYLWVNNSRSMGPTTQWALLTDDASDGNTDDDWTIPLFVANHTALPDDWELRNLQVLNSYKVVWGGADSSQGGTPGNYTNPTGAFTLQTHLVPVPEPTIATGLAVAALVCLRRRRR
jgi:hypothetical protein